MFFQVRKSDTLNYYILVNLYDKISYGLTNMNCADITSEIEKLISLE